jgi:hypothetical protein
MRLLIVVLATGAITGLLLSDISRAGDKGKEKTPNEAGKDQPKKEQPKDPNELDPITIKEKITKKDPLDPKREGSGIST